jgi:hypothetical protein
MSVFWHKLTAGLRRRWANKLPTHLELNSRWKAAVHSAPLNTFAEAKTAFRTAMSYRFVSWLNQNRDVFIASKASLRFVWA